MAEITLRIDGMHCGACVRRVGQALATVEGIEVKEVRVGAARFTTSAEPASPGPALEAIAKAGFTAFIEEG
jgi:copper chaperone CopZ